MRVTFHILSALREFTAGQSTVEIEYSATTLADALSASTRAFEIASQRSEASAGTYQYLHRG
jgi:hypothetical protein